MAVAYRMSDVVYESRVRVERTRGPHRLAHLPARQSPIEFGVHGPIAAHFGASPDNETTTTLDYVVAATGG